MMTFLLFLFLTAMWLCIGAVFHESIFSALSHIGEWIKTKLGKL